MAADPVVKTTGGSRKWGDLSEKWVLSRRTTTQRLSLRPAKVRASRVPAALRGEGAECSRYGSGVLKTE